MISDTLKEKIESLPAILSIREAADFFSVRYLTVYRLIRRGTLPAYKDDEGRWCVLRSDLKTYCSRNSNL
ncbi:MAG: excisionase family DNA-binding protein [Treponema sp.]|jgi:excisionase family DNA binding protein|nr:excisionase family DNA-binding protein [Treponema sp.]